MTFRPRPLAALAVALLASLPASAMEFTSQEEIDAVLAQDLNGDGKKELVWQTGRTVTVLFYKEPRGYSFKEELKAEFTLPPGAAAYAFGDVDGRGVIFYTSPGFFLHALDAKTGEHLENWGKPVPIPGFPKSGVIDLLADVIVDWAPWT